MTFILTSPQVSADTDNGDSRQAEEALRRVQGGQAGGTR
jgi:hypothetical protein